MGIYDREYYRGETAGSGWLTGAAPVCKYLIVVNVVVFLLEHLVKPDPSVITNWFAASPEYTLHHFRFWQLLTATFLHADPLHILGNMFFLWIVGREMEALYGSRDFLVLYVSAAVLSTLAWVLIHAAASRDQAVFMLGASGAVMAVVVLYALYYPKREILMFFVLPMPMWLVVLIFLAFPLLIVVDGGPTQIAFESHLAGAACGWAFKQFDLRWSRLVSGRAFKPRLRIFSQVPREQTRSRSSSPSWTSASVGGGGKSASVSVLPEEQLDARLDEVLAKIAREGRAGLTEEELRVLQEASRRARIRRSDRL
jgi:membrane associated rhomboid family serine protease